MPTNVQNFTQKDLIAVTIFDKVLWGLLVIKTPCSDREKWRSLVATSWLTEEKRKERRMVNLKPK